MDPSDADRQTFKDIVFDTDRGFQPCFEEARSYGCDVVQLKYDGWWSLIETDANVMRFYSRTAREFKSIPTLNDITSKMVGECMQGTQWSQEPGRLGRTFLFDIWNYSTHDLSNSTYRVRYNVLQTAALNLPDTFTVVPNYFIDLAPPLWLTHVENEATGYEGIIFRKSTDPIASTIYRCKKVVTADLQIIGFYEGQGKYVGTLGGVNARTADDIRVDVGGGFSDELRNTIWQAQESYLGRWFEIKARAKFESGSYRHPNFVRWRPDKDTATGLQAGGTLQS